MLLAWTLSWVSQEICDAPVAATFFFSPAIIEGRDTKYFVSECAFDFGLAEEEEGYMWMDIQWGDKSEVVMLFFFFDRAFSKFSRPQKTPPPSSKNDFEPKKKKKKNNLPGRIFAPDKIRNGRDRQSRRPCRGSFCRGCAWRYKTL